MKHNVLGVPRLCQFFAPPRSRSGSKRQACPKMRSLPTGSQLSDCFLSTKSAGEPRLGGKLARLTGIARERSDAMALPNGFLHDEAPDAACRADDQHGDARNGHVASSLGGAVRSLRSEIAVPIGGGHASIHQEVAAGDDPAPPRPEC